MEKLITFSLVMFFLLSLAACSANGTDDSKPQIGNNTTNSTPDNNTTSTPDNTITSSVDNDATIKAELIAKMHIFLTITNSNCITVYIGTHARCRY